MPFGPELEPFDALVGTWALEATHPMFPSTVVRGSAEFAWLEGERFLLQRSRTDHPDFPDSLIVFGADEDGVSMDYFDSRGVHRIYRVSFGDGVWRMWRHWPGFSQKFSARLSADGDTIEGLWTVSRNDSTWHDDLGITFRRTGRRAADASSAGRRETWPSEAPMTALQAELWVDRPSEAVAFYEAAFGATVLHRVGDGDDIVAQLAVGNGAFWVAGTSATMKRFSPPAVDGATGRMLLVVEDPERVVGNALAAGATESSPVSNEHGWRLGRTIDTFGHEWEIGTPLAPWPPN